MKKKEVGITIAGLGCIFLFISLLFLCFTFYDGVASFKRPADIFADSYVIKNLKETDMIESDIKLLFERYYKYDFSGNGTYSYFYVLPVVRDDGTYYMGLRVSEDERAEYDKLAEDTLAYLHGELDLDSLYIIPIKGRIAKMNYNNEAAFKRWFKQQDSSGYDRSKLLYYYINIDNGDSALMVFWVMMAGAVAGVVLIAIGISIIIKYNKAKREQVNVVIKGVSYPKEVFARADTFINNHENLFAIQEISNITGLDAQEAQLIVAYWNRYYL